MDVRDPSAEIVNESSRAFVVNAGPIRPIVEYPRSVIGKREYKFQSRWYDEFSWLEYSVTKDAAFCFYCRCFGTLVGSSEQTFTREGFKQWKNATGANGKLAKHSSSRMHLLSMERMRNFKSSNDPIDVQLVGAAQAAISRKEKEREENREIVRVIFDVIRHLAKQNNAFRGHDESDTAENRGNFLEELNFLAKYHQPLQKWIQQHPQNVSYFSPNTQNEMISVLSRVVTERIKGEVAYSKHFSIECDEVTSHKRAFMSVIVRYVYDFSIWERCIKLERVDSIKGKNLAEIIIAILEDMKFPIANLVGKGFDGASNMSGKDEGVQQHLTAAGATKSIYFHCFAHRLNLILEKGVSTVPAVQDVFDTIGSIYRYLEGSPKRHALYERKLREKGITKGKIALHSLSDTRWAAKSDNLDTVVNTMPAIIEMLKEMSIEGESAAEGLLVRMQKFKFILACFILKKCFALCKSVSEYLQFKEMDLVSAVSGIQSLKRALQDLRNDAKMEEFVQEADNYCQVSHLKVTNFEEEGISKRKRTIPAHFRDGSEILYGESSAVQEDQPDPSVYQKNRFRRDLYFPFLDRLISELDRRFSSQACEILLQASTFHPTKLMEDNVGKVKQIAAFYGVDSERVCSQFTLFSKSTEVALWKKEYGDYLKEKERAEKDKSIQMPQTWLCLPALLKIFAKNGLSNLFPDLFEVVKIIATLPATVASCERAHSKVKIINTYLRASMSDQRLEHLIKISIERDIAENIELDSLLELFKTSGNRKLAL